MIGINVNSRTIPFADLIIDGRKLYESRATNSLRPWIGQRVAIVKTGAGKARAVGAVTIGPPIIVNCDEFRALENVHLVPENSEFDIQPGGVKFLYPMIAAEKFETALPVARGIVARQVLFTDSGAL